LGVCKVQAFAVACVPLAVGRQWLLLTDGFVEARDSEGAQFGESALAEALSISVSEQTDPLKVLEDRWREFSKHGPDRDDATALLITSSSALPPANYVCEVSPENIPDLRFFCEQWVAFTGLAEVDSYQVVLAFDEILTNVYKHAYKSRPGPVRCDAWIDLTSLRFVITHWGIGLGSEANLPRSPEDSRFGGYGLPFVRRVFDEVTFESSEGRSTISLTRRIIPPNQT
jgi:anti-sigma regulatory factor (Ser/Thr protein kinase)